MATAFAHDVPDTSFPLARAAGKIAVVASAGAAAIAEALPGTSEDADAAAEWEFGDLLAQLQAIPGAKGRLRDALVRTGLLPSDHPGDGKLLEAWESWKAACSAIEASGDVPADVDAPLWRQRDAAEQVICAATATTAAGALVKLRYALDVTGPDRWAQQALYSGDDLTLVVRSDELDLDGRMIVDAIAVLSRRKEPIVTGLQVAISTLRDAEAAQQRFYAEVYSPASEARRAAEFKALAALPHQRTKASYENAFGERRYQTTEDPIAIETGRRVLKVDTSGWESEFVATCREGIALLDAREQAIEDIRERIRHEFGMDDIDRQDRTVTDAVHAAQDAVIACPCSSFADLLLKHDVLHDEGLLDEEDARANFRSDLERLVQEQR